ncbi:MAG: hypothetical protein PF795_03695, partial [Kiritimatiellae bacterium]|nr:hypothetical protein [Kiritimatiellia bacterium]
MRHLHVSRLVLTGVAILSAAGLYAQPGTRLVEREIPRMKAAPTIDGDFSDWEEIPPFELGLLSWKSKGDLGADVRLA